MERPALPVILGSVEKESFVYQYLATAAGCLSIICTGMHFGWPSPSLPQLFSPSSPITISSSDGSWMAVMPAIGAGIGALFSAYIIDKIGRKKSMLVTAPIYVLTWLMVAFTKSAWLLNLARLLVGITDGVTFIALSMYIGEISDKKIRGFLGSTMPFSLILGMLLINIIGGHLDIKTTALLSSIVPLLHFVSFIWMPESPYFFLMKDNRNEARRSLMKLKGLNNVETELNRIEQAIKEDLKNVGKFWDVFTVRSNLKALIICFGLRATQQFSGNHVINFYAKTIFDGAGSPACSTQIFFGVQLVMAIVASVLVDKLGRRPLLIFSIIFSGFALAAEGIFFYFAKLTTINPNLPVIALLIYVIVFNLGMGTIPVLMLGELFPPSVKAFAICLAEIYFGIIVTLVSKFFQIMSDNYGMDVPFLTFTFCCILGLIFIVLCVPETSGRTLEEIQEDLKKSKKTEAIEAQL